MNSIEFTASGQELAGFPQLLLGFSGTPNELNPTSIHGTFYSIFDDGKILTTLSNPKVVRETPHILEANSWDALQVLDLISPSKHNAFIDTAASTIGLHPKQVATYILEKRLKQSPFQGVVFVNRKHERVVLMRNKQVIPLNECGLEPHQRFTFYDHVHLSPLYLLIPGGKRWA